MNAYLGKTLGFLKRLTYMGNTRKKNQYLHQILIKCTPGWVGLWTSLTFINCLSKYLQKKISTCKYHRKMKSLRLCVNFQLNARLVICDLLNFKFKKKTSFTCTTVLIATLFTNSQGMTITKVSVDRWMKKI